jgi:hypothetical protein
MERPVFTAAPSFTLSVPAVMSQESLCDNVDSTTFGVILTMRTQDMERR